MQTIHVQNTDTAKERYIMLSGSGEEAEWGMDRYLTPYELKEENNSLREQGSDFRYVPYGDYLEWITENGYY